MIVVSIALIALGIVIIAFNGWALWMTHVRRKRFVSWIPLIGGVVCSAGLLAYPASFPWWAVVAPLLIDVGGVPGLVHAAVVHARAPRRE